VQLVSVLLRNGPRILAAILAGVTNWLVDHGYEDVAQLRGALNLSRCPDSAAFERANYIRILQSWRV
jgi:dihydroorotate dehydrogenase (fumarate)